MKRPSLHEHTRVDTGISELLDPGQVASLLGVTVGCLARWRCQGKPPAYIRLNGIVRYRREDVEAALAMRIGGQP